MRIRTWWGVLIHDRWYSIGPNYTLLLRLLTIFRSSLNHGTPALVNRREYNVPLPTLRTLLSPGDLEGEDMGAKCFLGLCQLTEILGEVLTIIYDLQPPKEETIMRILRKLESQLEDWEESAQDLLEAENIDDGGPAPGIRNLQLSFHALKKCICRIALHVSGLQLFKIVETSAVLLAA
jgi:hypothetical protein